MGTVDPFLDPPSPPQRYLVQRPQPWDHWRLLMESDTAWEVAETGTGRIVSPPGALSRESAERLRQMMEQSAPGVVPASMAPGRSAGERPGAGYNERWRQTAYL